MVDSTNEADANADAIIEDADNKVRAVLAKMEIGVKETGAGTIEAKQRMLQAFNKFFCQSQLEVYRLMAEEGADYCITGTDNKGVIRDRVLETLFCAYTKQEMPHLREKRKALEAT